MAAGAVSGGGVIPIYEYACFNGHKFERYLPLEDYSLPQTCECGMLGKRFLSPPLLVKVQQECRYDSPITGEPITTWQQRRNDLDKHNCQEYDPEMKRDADLRVHEADAKLDHSVDEHVERTWGKMPTKVRAAIASELVDHGVTAEIIRMAPPT